MFTKKHNTRVMSIAQYCLIAIIAIAAILNFKIEWYFDEHFQSHILFLIMNMIYNHLMFEVQNSDPTYLFAMTAKMKRFRLSLALFFAKIKKCVDKCSSCVVCATRL